ncbi:hypothetical protein ACP4OV_024202 [Aristida adscensionis]
MISAWKIHPFAHIYRSMNHDGEAACLPCLPLHLLSTSHAVMSMCACTTKQKPKATTTTHVRHQSHEMISIFIYGVPVFVTYSPQTLSLQNTHQYTIQSSNMCPGSWNSTKHPFFLVLKKQQQQQQQQQQNRPRVSVSIRRKRLRLRRRAGAGAGAEAMEMVNLKLYLENRCIVAENERLRERATALRRENLALRESLSKTAAAAAAADEPPATGTGAA